MLTETFQSHDDAIAAAKRILSLAYQASEPEAVDETTDPTILTDQDLWDLGAQNHNAACGCSEATGHDGVRVDWAGGRGIHLSITVEDAVLKIHPAKRSDLRQWLNTYPTERDLLEAAKNATPA